MTDVKQVNSLVLIKARGPHAILVKNEIDLRAMAL